MKKKLIQNLFKTGAKIIAYGIIVYSCEEVLGDLTFVTDSCSAPKENNPLSQKHTVNYGVGYSDAVAAISQSDMFSVHQQAAIDSLIINGSEEYYKAIIAIAKGHGFSSHKLSSIRNIS